jgi:cell cycle sensor histidine kinase DivJ
LGVTRLDVHSGEHWEVNRARGAASIVINGVVIVSKRMRSLFSFGASREMSLAIAGTGHRPEMLRRRTLASNSRLAILLCALTVPLATFWLVGGHALPLVVASLGLIGALLTLALHQRGLFEYAAGGQVYTMLAAGSLLTIADTRLADPGLAVALMAPVLASMVGRASLRRQSWAMLAAVGAIGLATSWFPVAMIDSDVLMATGALAFLVSVVVVLHTGNKISAAYEVYDKAQVSAYRHLIEHVQDAVLRFSNEGDVLRDAVWLPPVPAHGQWVDRTPACG